MSQESLVQPFLSSHDFRAPAMHWPFWHESVAVHALPSEQAPGVLGNAHLPVVGSQVSRVQALPSLHTVALPLHLPVLKHASLLVQSVPSSQAAPVLAVLVHFPVAVSHLSSVQGLESSQGTAVPAHAPVLVQRSVVVHRLASSQAFPVCAVLAHL